MSKLISEEIVEAITLGDKEGFMSAFHSALAAKVSDALEIKKVEIASTLIAPASSEVVEEEVEQIDEAANYTLKHVGTSHPKDVTDDEDQPVKATEKSYEIHKGGKKVGELEHHHNEYGGHFYSGNLHGRRFPWDRNNNSLGGKNDAHSYLASALKSKWHTSKHSATNEEVEQIDEAKYADDPAHKIASGLASKMNAESPYKNNKGDVHKHIVHSTKEGDGVTHFVTQKRDLSGDHNTPYASVTHRDNKIHWEVGNSSMKQDPSGVHSPKEAKSQLHAAIDATHKRIRTKYDMDLSPEEARAANQARVQKSREDKMKNEEVEQVDEATPEAKGQSRAEWRMGTPDVIAKNNAKIADRKARAKKKLLSMNIPAKKGK